MDNIPEQYENDPMVSFNEEDHCGFDDVIDNYYEL